jgi:hypothetical protein
MRLASQNGIIIITVSADHAAAHMAIFKDHFSSPLSLPSPNPSSNSENAAWDSPTLPDTWTAVQISQANVDFSELKRIVECLKRLLPGWRTYFTWVAGKPCLAFLDPYHAANLLRQGDTNLDRNYITPLSQSHTMSDVLLLFRFRRSDSRNIFHIVSIVSAIFDPDRSQDKGATCVLIRPAICQGVAQLRACTRTRHAVPAWSRRCFASALRARAAPAIVSHRS